MMAPRSLAQMIEATRLDEVKTAIVARLAALMPGVTVIGHPGKLDVNDVVAKKVVAAPGVAVGWSRSRADRQVDGASHTIIDFVAYVVTQDHVDVAARRSTPRDVVAHAIGSTILDILADPSESSWGIARLERPAGDPAPALTPIFTATSWTEGVAYYSVTWSQVLWRTGKGLFEGPTPDWSADGTGVAVEFGDSPIPPEVVALAGRFFGGEDV